MAINFPDTPAEGDVHVVGTRSWTWDGVAWTSNTSRDYINTVSETEPSNPAPGDTWFKSSTGQTFLYYDNYWIETGVAGPAGPAGADGADGSDASLTRAIRNVSADTTLLADDANQMVRFTGTDQQVLTIPDVLTPGQSVHVVQDNTGQIEFASGSGVTLLSDSGEFGSNGQNTRVDIVCVADGEYRLYGELVAVVIPTVEYLVIAGGGGAGSGLNTPSGGGGAGGYRSSVTGESSGGGSVAESPFEFSLNTNYTVTVGAGGNGASALATNTNNPGSAGSNSVFHTITSIGGGRGTIDQSPGTGGSGGGKHLSGAGGSGTAGQGFSGAGGTGQIDPGTARTSGGGGGAGGAGQNGASNNAGNGGTGVQSNITGTLTYRAGGGGGGTRNSSNLGSGGAGGGGNGGGGNSDPETGVPAQSGTANTGGGGGGQGNNGSTLPGGSGGSGVVILRYPSDYTATIGAGLTGSTATVGENKVTTITAGTGNISFS